ncbi:LysM peptidoglycan-binding domain-containing protein [Dyella subtropica]|uniref:LysM peptidoglycan-binding domain-containing protein n=1 Tax=Dyella subtropica TaxID=2992127 RepID=UPI002259519D|nr:LysM peptidoglycan-binding domain-containing protein [Dyella subtropica]
MIPRDFDTSSSPVALSAAQPAPSQQPQSYRVQRTDSSLDSIAQHFGTTKDAIVHANPGKFSQSLKVVPGDVLIIPPADLSAQSAADANKPKATPQQQVDKALADLHNLAQVTPRNRSEVQDLADARSSLQDQLNKAVDAEVQARLSTPDTSLTPQQRKALGDAAPTQADRATDIRKDIVSRYQGDAAVQQAVDTQEANTLLANNDQGGYSSPKDKLLALDASLKTASSDQVRALATGQDSYRNTLQAAADWAAQPYDGNTHFSNYDQYTKAGQGVEDSSARYADLLSGISSPEMKASLLADAHPQLDKLAHFAFLHNGQDMQQHSTAALTSLSSIVGSLGQQNPAGAQALAADLASQMTNGRVWAGWPGNISILSDAATKSGDPTLALNIIDHVRGDGKDRMANDWSDRARGEVLQATTDATSRKVDNDVETYVQAAGELNSLIAKEGASMTPDQLNQAIENYGKSKGAEWKQSVNDAITRLADDGKHLLSQQAALSNWVASHPGDKDAIGKVLNSVMGSENNQAAIRLAVQRDPTVMQGEQGESLINMYALYAKAGDQGTRKLMQELGTNYVAGRLNELRAGLKANDLDSLRTTCDGLTKLGDDSRLATVLAMSGDKQADIKAATEALKANITKTFSLANLPQDPQAALADNLEDLDKRLSGMKAFDKGSALGTSFRLFSVSAAGLGFLNSVDKMGTIGQQGWEDKIRNSLSLLASSAGLGQKTAGLLSHLSLVPEKGKIAQFGTTLWDRWINGASGALDFWKAGDSLFEKHDGTEAALYATTGTGSVMWALGAGSWAGPVGIALTAVGTIGLISYQDKKANDHAVPGREAFLQGLGYSKDAADALSAWHSKNDAPATSMLLHYGEQKGMNQQQTIAWFNGLGQDQQKTFAGAMVSALDTVGGDASKLQKTAKDDGTWDDMAKHNYLLSGTVSHGIFGMGAGVVDDGSKLDGLTEFPVNGEEQPSSVHQLDIVLKNVLGVNPP